MTKGDKRLFTEDNNGNTTRPQKRIRTTNDQLYLFGLLNADEICQVILHLDLASIVALKSTCKTHYSTLETTPRIWKHMYTLALKTVPPASLVTLEECDSMVKQLHTTANLVAEKQWTEQYSQFHEKLNKYRNIVQQGLNLSEELEEQYQQLLRDMAQTYINSKIEKKECSRDEGYAGLDFYWHRSSCYGDSYSCIPISMILDYILEGNDLTVPERDQQITELICARIGSCGTD